MNESLTLPPFWDWSKVSWKVHLSSFIQIILSSVIKCRHILENFNIKGNRAVIYQKRGFKLGTYKGSCCCIFMLIGAWTCKNLPWTFFATISHIILYGVIFLIKGSVSATGFPVVQNHFSLICYCFSFHSTSKIPLLWPHFLQFIAHSTNYLDLKLIRLCFAFPSVRCSKKGKVCNTVQLSAVRLL